ncbi:MAG: sensor histidine kinase [Opitutaceae bacterium]
MTSDTYDHRSTGGLYGAVAFALVVVTCFTGYFFNQRFYMPASMVPVTFALGAIYGTLGILGSSLHRLGGGAGKALYFVLQCAILTALIWLSPLRGSFAIIVLPVVSEAIFELRPRNAIIVGAYLFLQTILVWMIPYGPSAVLSAIFSYAAAFGFTIAFTLVTRHALTGRERERALREDLERAHQKLQASAAQTAELATTRERNRLAREIHDGVGHYLTVVKTQLDAAAALIPTQPERAREVIGSAAKLTAEALADVRRSVGTLRADAARPALADALTDLARHGEPVPSLTIEGETRALPSAVEHALFRAAQEALTNVRKHAGARQASVVLDYRAPGRVGLEVADDGRGPGTTASGGFGLIGLRERIELLGGHVEAGPGPDGGFRLRVEVPA